LTGGSGPVTSVTADSAPPSRCPKTASVPCGLRPRLTAPAMDGAAAVVTDLQLAVLTTAAEIRKSLEPAKYVSTS